MSIYVHGRKNGRLARRRDDRGLRRVRRKHLSRSHVIGKSLRIGDRGDMIGVRLPGWQADGAEGRPFDQYRPSHPYCTVPYHPCHLPSLPSVRHYQSGQRKVKVFQSSLSPAGKLGRQISIRVFFFFPSGQGGQDSFLLGQTLDPLWARRSDIEWGSVGWRDWTDEPTVCTRYETEGHPYCCDLVPHGHGGVDEASYQPDPTKYHGPTCVCH